MFLQLQYSFKADCKRAKHSDENKYDFKVTKIEKSIFFCISRDLTVPYAFYEV